jgi:hypothetical protein
VSNDQLSQQRAKRDPDRASRLVVIWTMIVGIFLAGVAFAYKIATFIFTLSSPDFRGTFDVSITVYFFVSAGWLCVLVWAFLTGKFKQMERAKYDLLKQEEEYERLGI